MAAEAARFYEYKAAVARQNFGTERRAKIAERDDGMWQISHLNRSNLRLCRSICGKALLFRCRSKRLRGYAAVCDDRRRSREIIFSFVGEASFAANRAAEPLFFGDLLLFNRTLPHIGYCLGIERERPCEPLIEKHGDTDILFAY